MTTETQPRLVQPLRAIKEAGFTFRIVEYCEDSRTPGFLGQIRGVTDWEMREVRISEKANPTIALLRDAIYHEARHVTEPEWDCGSRDVLGRGGPKR